MRVFAGLPVPEQMTGKIRQVCDYLKEKYRGLNVVKSEGLHVTLYFFGELPEHSVHELIHLMDDRSLIQKKIEASFHGFGQFPPRGNPRVLYVHIEKGKELITAYYEKYVHLIRPHGFGAPPDKEFVPHITIARNKRERLPRDFPASLPFVLNDFFTINRCVLYQSVLTPAGAEYKALKTIMFS
ncbi:MAG: RNA 2',3'-cyclic phosphodiesterase [Spirochaetales bacterium]|nr:RNA 2',3'-cyclic phosphodiesterase [Spirochaetales bacterium]